MKRFYLIALLLVFAALPSFAETQKDSLPEEQPRISIRFDARLDGEITGYKSLDGTELAPDQTYDAGFLGQYFNFMIDGTISKHFSYSMRQRLIKANTLPLSFLNSIDWLYLKYNINRNFSITAGKQAVFIGGYEYDANPIDIYFWSGFMSGVPSGYEIGFNVGFESNDGNHRIMAQMVNSPFAPHEFMMEKLFAYNLIWYGHLGCFHPIYSFNMIEYEQGKYINYIALGNRWNAGRFQFDLDYTNRAKFNQEGFFKDFSVGAKIEYAVADRWMIFLKGGYDQNLVQNPTIEQAMTFDRVVLPGTQYCYYGGGVEYYPIKKLRNKLRIHAFFHSNQDVSKNPDMEHPTRMPFTFNIGVRWQFKAFER